MSEDEEDFVEGDEAVEDVEDDEAVEDCDNVLWWDDFCDGVESHI